MFSSRRRNTRKRVSLRHESGQSLVIVILSMFVIFVIAAMAIDLATWYQKHHQEQVAADAAALAAANCLANESSTNTGTNACTSPSDTTDASQVATNLASTNQSHSSTVSYALTTDSNGSAVKNVTVTTSAPDSTIFSRLVGLAPTVSSSAVATVYTNLKNCGVDGIHCLMFYAAASNCNSPSITFQTGNSVNLIGGILTNGPIDDSKGNGGNFEGGIAYGSGTTCNTNTHLKGNANFTYNPSQQNVDYGSSASPNWPINYATYFPACTVVGTGSTQCASTGGTNKVAGAPNYCTYSSTASSWTANLGDGVYCAIGSGTGVSAGNPATWNGALTAPSSGSVTLIGGTVSDQGGTLSAYSNNLFAYATSSEGCTTSGQNSGAFYGYGGNTTFTGDVFVPNGCALITGGAISFTGFVQAQTINYYGGSSTGDGPAYATNPGNLQGGSDALSG